MFLESSRYYKVRRETATATDGRTVSVVALRRLPEPSGKITAVKEGDRLDILAKRFYDDATRFWHIADANTELEASELVCEAGNSFKVPEQ